MNINNTIVKYNRELKSKAQELADKYSPDVTKLEAHVVDDKTIVYFEKGIDPEIIKKRIDRIKKSINNAVGAIIYPNQD